MNPHRKILSNTNNATDYCFQSYFTQNLHSQEIPNINNNVQAAELKFKIESVGVHPENDDDLHMCPARVRPSWPKKIIPWWVASSSNEKPPYSYATLIAHAILSNKDGRLTLNDIYTWIAENYPAFSIGHGGWQNSIRHNLSLNKKWFCKIDRRPTQANPGKGCYWTLVAGTEQIFIDNLTQEGGHSRKHHDIGLTAELSIRQQRRGACFYHNASTTAVTPDNNQHQQNFTFDTNALTTPPPTPTKSKTLIPPLYTTFKMVNMNEKSQQRPENNETHDDSDNDSGVDVNIKFVDTKHFRKRRRTTNSSNDNADRIKKHSISSSIICAPSSSMQNLQQHVSTSMVYDTPTSTPVSSFNLAPTSFEINNWVENSLIHSENEPFNVTQHDLQWPTTAENNLWCDSIVVPPLPLPALSSNNSNISSHNNYKKRSPITIILDDEEITHKYLHFEEDEEDLISHASIIPQFIPSMPIHNNLVHKYHNLYPHTDPLNTSSYTTTLTPYNNSTLSFTNNQLLQQFVSMQDILYS